MNLAQHLPVLTIVTLLIAAYLMPLFARWNRYWCAPTIVTALSLSFLAALLMVFKVMKNGPFTYHMGNWPPPWGIELSIDYLAVYMGVIITGIALLIIIFGIQQLPSEIRANRLGAYYTIYLLLVASMLGISFTNDMFNLFVFVEISSISACALISTKDARESIEAAFKYLVLSAVGSGCLLLAIAMIYMVTGHLNFDFIFQELPHAIVLYPNNIMAALALLMVGLGVKSALFPLHVWLPDAYSHAPDTSSAILAGLVGKTYAVAMIKILYNIFPADLFLMVPVMNMLLWMSTLAIIIGSMFAIVQDDIKRMLAYSSIAQIGYIFLGVSLMGENALLGGILHIFNHALMKSMLFLAAGAFIYATGTRKLSELKGIGHTMPIPAVAFSIGALAMVGIPTTNGFISKWYLALGALDVNRPFSAAVIIVSSLLNGIYYLPIIVNAFFGRPEGAVAEPRPLPNQMLVPIMVLGFGCVIFGVFPQLILNLVSKATLMLTGL